MIIEFFGPSGVGKTTIAQRLSSDTGLEYISIDSRKEKIKYVIIFLFRFPIRFLLLFVLTAFEGKSSHHLVRHKIHLLSEYIARNEKARIKSKKRNVVLDEGLAQYGLALYERNISDLVARKYINMFGDKSNILNVVISCSDIERIGRMKKRQRIPRAYIEFDKKKWQKIIGKNANVFTKIFAVQNALVFDSLECSVLTIVKEIKQNI